MTYHEAFGAVLYGVFGLLVGGWYLWCWWTMLFRCRPMRGFFSQAYSTSSPFLLVNFLLVLAGAAQVLVWLTN